MLKILLLLSVCIFSQTLEVGIIKKDDIRFCYFVESKILRWGDRIGMGFVGSGDYRNYWNNKAGIRIGAGKVYVTPWICKDKNDFYWAATIGVYLDRRY